MNKLLEENISWPLIEGDSSGQMECEIDEAFIKKETGVLTVIISLNFVVPIQDDQRIQKALKASIPDISGVDISYKYDKEHMVISRDAIIKLFVPRMTRDSKSSLRNTVRADRVEISGDTVEIATLGKVAMTSLNNKLSKEFKDDLSNVFGIHVDVTFVNDEELYQEKAKALAKTQVVPVQPANAAPAAQSAPAAGGQTAPKTTEKKSPKGGRIMGKKIAGEETPLSSLTAELGHVVISGMLFKKEARAIKNGRQMITLLITDKRTSTCLKIFAKDDKWEEMNDKLVLGNYIKAGGDTEWNRYENCLNVMVKDLETTAAPRREDTYEGGKRVELHAHTKMSAMDGLNEPDKMVDTAAYWGQPAIAVTDHGVVQSFPDAANEAAKLAKKGVKIKILYGMEGYVFDDADYHLSNGQIDYKKPTVNHIILMARTQEGLKNIYKLVSISHLNYYYYKPRLPKSVIAEHREGVIIGSACQAGEVYQAILNGHSDEDIERIASFYDYLEIQPLINDRFLVNEGTLPDKEALMNINRRIVALADKLGKPVVATTDAHYDEPESAIYRNILMAGMGFKDAESGEGLYLRTTDEMMEEFAYLGEEDARRVVIDNTNLIADMIDDDIKPVPDGKYPPRIEGAEETLRRTCMDRAHEMYGDPLPDRIEERLDKELNSIINNGYAVMYVSAQMLVQKSLSDGYLVGSRGSVGSSLAATMAGITEVNPLEPHYICPKCKHLEWGDMTEYDCGIDMPEKACPECGTMMKRDGFTIPFATFLGFNGDKEPDIDLNFAGEYQAKAHKYVGEIFGEKNVYKAGTVGTIADKTAYGYVMKYFDETGRPANKFEADRLVSGCTGVKRTTGQHPGGIIIVPDDHEIYEFCPVQHPANDSKSDIVTTHFDYHKIDKNLLKLDILGHNIPSMIRQLQDMTGVDPLTVDLSDRKVLSIFNGIEALNIKDKDYKGVHGTYAIPEFGTAFVRQMLDDTKPDKFADLVRISGFSHGTDVWLNNAQDYIRSGVATMREVISTRDDIMNYLILKGIENKTSFQIMEDVRKNRPLKPEQLQVMKEHGVPDWYIDSCIKIQYMFPRAHAVAYVMMSFRMAWYKVYYPAEFYATFFTSVAQNFDADTILKGSRACLDRMDELNLKGSNATAKEKDEYMVLEVAYEMYARGFTFAPPRLGASHALKFWVENSSEPGTKHVILPFVALNGVGESAATALADAYEEHPFDTVEDAVHRAGLTKTAVEILRTYDVFEGLPETDQLSWAF